MSAPALSSVPAPTETIEVASRVVACDGGTTALGHPRVFLRITGTEIVCPYCSRRYVLRPDAPVDAH